MYKKNKTKPILSKIVYMPRTHKEKRYRNIACAHSMKVNVNHFKYFHRQESRNDRQWRIVYIHAKLTF